MTRQEVFIQVHDIKINAITNYIKYYDYWKLHFGKVILEDMIDNCQIQVNADWESGDLRKKMQKKELNKIMTAIGANTFINSESISVIRKIGRKRKVKLDFSLKKDRLVIQATSQKKNFKDKIRYDIFGQPQEPYFFELTYTLIYYPLFWYLEYFKNTHVLHASAVKIRNKCIVICGLEGIGKTTLSLSLAKETGARFFSDNLIFYDDFNVSPCYEPVRIHKTDEKSLWEGNFKRINEFRTLKDFYEPVSFTSDLKEKPDIFILPSFDHEFSVKEIPKDRFVNRLLILNQLTAELGNYNEYAALLNLLKPDFKIWESRQQALTNIMDSARCYEIGMRKADGIERNIQSLKDFIHKTGQD